jgi:hypothetical protein
VAQASVSSSAANGARSKTAAIAAVSPSARASSASVLSSRTGSPIRWLGDGGMFHFRDPAGAVEAGLDMVEQAPAIELPPTHIGIQAGPVDLPGRRCARAGRQPPLRLASVAQAGEVVVSEEVVR